jgi:hypothetical protein
VSKNDDLKVWWCPQIPCPSFDVEVSSLNEAGIVLDVLGRYDAFQLENNIKPDYCNAGGLVVFEDGEWVDWEHPETFQSFDDWRRGESA